MEQRQFTPVPDPTLLTTAALTKSVETLKEYFESRIECVKELLIEKINSINKLKEEKFKETWDRLSLMESQRMESKQDNEKAIAHALSAQERIFRQMTACSDEADKKQDANVDKQLDAIRALLNTNVENIRATIGSLKERIDRGTGKEDQQVTNRMSAQWIIGLIIAIVLSMIGDVVMVVHIISKP